MAENKMPLITANRGLTRADRATLDEVERRAARITARIEATGGFAEVHPTKEPHWHAAIAFAQRERTAAGELSDRGFGVCIPEFEVVEIKRGRQVKRRELLLPGYVLFFGWNIDNQVERVRACEGIYDMLFFAGHPAIVPDWVMSDIRRTENTLRPLTMMVDEANPKKRHRHSLKARKQVDVHDYDVVATHSYSPFIEAMRQESPDARVSAFHKAMGLAA